MPPLVISAPFGNWLQFPYAVPTLGTFTPAFRAGTLKRLWRIARTVRYSWTLRSMVNKLGLPNPGIESVLSRGDANRVLLQGKIVSIHGFNTSDWSSLFGRLTDFWSNTGWNMTAPPHIELNVSCPNVKDSATDWFRVFGWARGLQDLGLPVIVKLPPIRWSRLANMAYDAGLRFFHCCNTIPHPRGGVSGKVLKPLSLDVIESMKGYNGDVKIIGGGGITGRADIEDYRNAGADHFAVGSALFSPWNVVRMRKLARVLYNEKEGSKSL